MRRDRPEKEFRRVNSARPIDRLVPEVVRRPTLEDSHKNPHYQPDQRKSRQDQDRWLRADIGFEQAPVESE